MPLPPPGLQLGSRLEHHAHPRNPWLLDARVPEWPARNISSSLDGGKGLSFDYKTAAPYRNSVFGRAGISAKVGDQWSGSVFYNLNFGAEGYTNNIISTSLGFSF